MLKINILLALVLTCFLVGCKNGAQQNSSKLNNSLGKKFYLKDIVDTSGQKIELDFSKSELTLIDFWNNTCPPCISEMKQFPSLIKDKGNKISIDRHKELDSMYEVKGYPAYFVINKKGEIVSTPGSAVTFLKDLD